MIDKAHVYKEKVKFVFDRRSNQKSFQMDDLVLWWNARRKDRDKHGKFDNLWFGPFRAATVLDNNTFLLKNLDDELVVGGPVNDLYLKHFYVY